MKQLRVTISVYFQALTHYLNITYVSSHEWAYLGYSVSILKILICIPEVLVFMIECDTVWEDPKGFFACQTPHIRGVHTDQFSRILPRAVTWNRVDSWEVCVGNPAVYTCTAACVPNSMNGVRHICVSSVSMCAFSNKIMRSFAVFIYLKASVTSIAEATRN
jgi:hypothetical protein